MSFFLIMVAPLLIVALSVVLLFGGGRKGKSLIRSIGGVIHEFI